MKNWQYTIFNLCIGSLLPFCGYIAFMIYKNKKSKKQYDLVRTQMHINLEENKKKKRKNDDHQPMTRSKTIKQTRSGQYF
jgi:amino acid permease